ncbi:MAG TPA: DNA-formamidopyrimidine glycosylase family protein, partial [Solirubrobacterales bacterium]|nr:DNA-formamidopyrimidine glycosylase family protein [Solirubrobacterales bacterium]
MPELPEVETVCRQLDPELRGRRIERLEALDSRWCRPVPPAELEARVSGATIRGLGRRGKYLLLGLDGARTLVMHLRMTGNLVLVEGESMLDPSLGRRLYEGERSVSARHLRARVDLDDGREVWFTDPRRFGEAFLIDDAELAGRFERLGPEPLSAEFTAEALGAIASGRT